MPSVSRLAAAAAFIYSVTASALGFIPSQTIPGFGAPLFAAEPTEAPKFELVKARLQKKAVTNICTEWTIPGGFGQPECFNSETCLFTSASDIWYEGCAQTSIAYNWITECYPYSRGQSSPPVSVTYCPATAPSCGFYAFIFGEDETAWNLGCSTVSYSWYVELLPTVTGDSTSTDVVLAGNGGSSIAVSVATTNIVVTQVSSTDQASSTAVLVAGGSSRVAGGSSLTSSASSSTSSSSTSTSLPNVGSHAASSSSTPIGAIVGGVVGGIAVIAFIAFLVWFFLRKRRQDKAAAQAHEAQVQANQANSAGSAFNNNNRISEIAGTMKPPAPPANTYVPPPGLAGVYGEKPAAVANSQDVYRPPPQELNNSAYTENQPHSPPPVYAHPADPPAHYNELEQQNAGIARPMSASPAPTGNSQGVSPITTPTPQQQYQHMSNMSMISNATELSGHNMQPQPQPSYSPRPGFQEMATGNAAMPMRPTFQQMPSSNTAIHMRPAGAPPGVQEMNANMQQAVPMQAVPMRPAGPPAGIQEMSGYPAAASGGVNRPPQAQAQRFDMNGAPMGEYQELE